MDTNINYEELLDIRSKLVDDMLNNFSSWDGEIETGIKIIEENAQNESGRFSKNVRYKQSTDKQI